MNFKRLHSPVILKGLLLSTLLLVCNFYLLERQVSRADYETGNDNSAPHIFVISESSESGDVAGNDVGGNDAPFRPHGEWLLAVDVANSYGSSINHKNYKSPILASLVPLGNCSLQDISVQTLSQVNTALGRQFTLVGERPSGTS